VRHPRQVAFGSEAVSDCADPQIWLTRGGGELWSAHARPVLCSWALHSVPRHRTCRFAVWRLHFRAVRGFSKACGAERELRTMKGSRWASQGAPQRQKLCRKCAGSQVGSNSGVHRKSVEVRWRSAGSQPEVCRIATGRRGSERGGCERADGDDRGGCCDGFDAQRESVPVRGVWVVGAVPVNP